MNITSNFAKLIKQEYQEKAALVDAIEGVKDRLVTVYNAPSFDNWLDDFNLLNELKRGIQGNLLQRNEIPTANEVISRMTVVNSTSFFYKFQKLLNRIVTTYEGIINNAVESVHEDYTTISEIVEAIEKDMGLFG